MYFIFQTICLDLDTYTFLHDKTVKQLLCSVVFVDWFESRDTPAIIYIIK